MQGLDTCFCQFLPASAIVSDRTGATEVRPLLTEAVCKGMQMRLHVNGTLPQRCP